MAFDSNFIDDLKMQVNIVDVIGREVNLKKAGANYKGLCPFHNEKTPSFMVSEEKQIFNCFGCGQKGDVIKFVEAFYKIPFMEAVEKICNENGIKMPETSHSRPRIDYDKYYAINAKAARFFYHCLGLRNNKGLAYLQHRGLSSDTITKFGLGYAPDSWDSLVNYLRSEKVEDADILKLGLAKQGKNGLYDKFRDRVMFPIINTQGKVIGFGGRAIGDIKPKYLNSDESEIFLKKNNLYGLNMARSEAADLDRIILVEGYMDMISLYQYGVKNVVASLGTALTDNQAKLICRYTKNVVLSYDSDDAGINAALRGIDVVNRAGGKVKILRIKDGKDPDEFVRKNGKDGFDRLVSEAIPATEFKLELAARDFDLSNDFEVLDYIEKVVPVLKSIGPVEQDLYIRKLADRYNISERAIAMAVQTDESNSRRPAFSNYKRQSRKSAASAVNNRDTRIEMSFLVLAMNNTRYLARMNEDGIRIQSQLGQKIKKIEESLEPIRENGTHRIDEKLIYAQLEPDEESVFSEYVKSIIIGPDDELFYRDNRTTYLINGYREKRVELLNDLAVAEKLDQPEEVERLATELIKIDHLIKSTTEDENA